MPAAIPKNNFQALGSPTGLQLAAYSFSGLVANRDALTAQSDPDNPYGVLLGADTYHANVVPIPTYGAAYIGLTAWLYASNDAATATAPIVRIYGHIPNPPGARDANTWPQDVASEFLNLNHASIPDDLKGLWVPLTKPNYTPGTPQLTLTTPAASRSVAATSIEHISEEGYAFLRGCDYVIVLVSTAATLSAGATKKGVIMASLFG